MLLGTVFEQLFEVVGHSREPHGFLGPGQAAHVEASQAVVRQQIAEDRFGGCPDRPQRPRAGPERASPAGVAGLFVPGARCHAGEIMHLAGGHRRAGRQPVDPVAGGPGVGVAAKKKSVHAAERDTRRVVGLRRDFIEALQSEDVTRFTFVDETSTTLTYCCRYARAEGGQRAHQITPLHGGPNVTLVAALTSTGLQAAMTVSGAVNRQVFTAYISQVLGPTLVQGGVVVLDNLLAHKAAGLAELVEARGAHGL